MKKVIEEDKRSDVQRDMDTLSEIRDELSKVLKSSLHIDEKISLASSIVNVINARQNSELLQLRIWGILEGHDHNHGDEDGEHCPDCGGLMDEHEVEPKKKMDDN